MLLHVRPGRWWRGNFSGDGVCPRRMSGGSLFVSSELLIEGEIFPGREFVLVGLPVKIGEFVRKFQVTKMLLHVTLGRWWREDLSDGFLRGGLVHSLLRSLMIC